MAIGRKDHEIPVTLLQEDLDLGERRTEAGVSCRKLDQKYVGNACKDCGNSGLLAGDMDAVWHITKDSLVEAR